MIRKTVNVFSSALREISEASTSSATFNSAEIPQVIRSGSGISGKGVDDIHATGIRLLLGVTSRTTNDGAALSLLISLEEKDPTGVWRGIIGTTMTPVVTATTYETLDIYPGGDVTSAPLRRNFLLPSALRAVARLQGSITATPGMTFRLDAELFS